ncbi:MAG TPA: hypothetical protein VFF57_07045, partial [Hanamia sp.]|nr:hypothetical protein [Hanamia sp.]
ANKKVFFVRPEKKLSFFAGSIFFVLQKFKNLYFTEMISTFHVAVGETPTAARSAVAGVPPATFAIIRNL